MGKVFSRPKIPRLPPPVADPVVTYQPPEPSEPDTEHVAGEQRVKNLIRRSRSMFGNIGTSVRGVLSDQNFSDQRKKLLGE